MNRQSRSALFEMAYFGALFEVIWLVHVSLTKAHGPLAWAWHCAALAGVVAFGIVLLLRRRLHDGVMQ